MPNPYEGLRAGAGAFLGSVAAGLVLVGVHRLKTGKWPPEGDFRDETSTRRAAAAGTLVGLVVIPTAAAALAPKGHRVGAAVGAAIGWTVPQVATLALAHRMGSYGELRPRSSLGKLAVDVGLPVVGAAAGAAVSPRWER